MKGGWGVEGGGVAPGSQELAQAGLSSRPAFVVKYVPSTSRPDRGRFTQTQLGV